jgi:hypothetical protein
LNFFPNHVLSSGLIGVHNVNPLWLCGSSFWRPLAVVASSSPHSHRDERSASASRILLSALPLLRFFYPSSQLQTHLPVLQLYFFDTFDVIYRLTAAEIALSCLPSQPFLFFLFFVFWLLWESYSSEPIR